MSMQKCDLKQEWHSHKLGEFLSRMVYRRSERLG